MDVGSVPDDVTFNASTTINRTGSKINFIEIVLNTITYRQTWTYTGDFVTALSAWVEQ